MMRVFITIAFVGSLFLSCTQEQQNRLSRSVQNWTGTDGVLDILGESKVLYRFIKIDKMTTGMSGDKQRSYRYGYGILDKNLNYEADLGEKKVYFEVSDYSTPYVFYSNPK